MSAGLGVETLAEPIVRLLASFGSGMTGGAGAALREASGVVEGVQQTGRGGINGMYASWNGRGGDGAMDKALRVQDGAAMASDRGEAMAAVVDRAGAEVAAGQREVEEILRSFLAKVDAAGAAGFSPGALALIVGAAIDHVGQALRVVERVRAELDAETAAMSELVSTPPTPAPAGVTTTSASSAEPAVVPAAVHAANGGGQQIGSTLASSGGQVLQSGASLASGLSTTAASVGDSSPRTHERTRPNSADTRPAGTGVKVTLPDGSTVEAPNQQAADAVRNALGAVGTPYVWGGTTPGSGLDCSGLTQWAYGEAGVRLPRLAQEQGYGHQQVGPGDLMPGDLAVWDGHVAMVIGNGQLVEAGDPVQTGPIRTENMGMRFLGFYRPTT